MRNVFYIFLLFASLLLYSCGSGKANSDESGSIIEGVKPERPKRFTGNYNLEFNDLQDLHMSSAEELGIPPLESRDDTIKYRKKLVRLPDELELYRTYDLTHSVPFLVPTAAKLFIDIAHNFRDSLYSKELPLYKLYLTSVLRSDDDVASLTTRNTNASHNSTHRYGTTFDISWKRFDQVVPDSTNEVMPERLKLVLAQVIYDLKNEDRCYVKHERQQACFHITAR